MSGGSRDKELRMGGRGSRTEKEETLRTASQEFRDFFPPMLAHPLQMGAGVLELERGSYQASWTNVCEDGMPK